MKPWNKPSTTDRAWAEIDLDAIRANVRSLRTTWDCGIMAVVKADAYGHGLLPVSCAALAAGAEWVGVATVAEGVALRETGVRAPIALLCVFAPDEAPAIVDGELTPLIGDRASVDALAHAWRRSERVTPLEVHLDIDTGMGRSGVLPEEAVALWRYALGSELHVSGLFTHLADADGANHFHALGQLGAFESTRRVLEQSGADFEYVHHSNSATTLRFPRADINLVRPGLLLYGILPPMPEAAPALRPALTLKARVASVRALPQGHTISYGATHTLTRPSIVATVLIGYGDGYPRSPSNGGHLLVHGQRAPILGRVCMDQLVVDVTDIPGVVSGEVAVCIGVQGNERITVEEIAARINTTEHIITTGLTSRLPRLYLNETSGTPGEASCYESDDAGYE